MKVAIASLKLARPSAHLARQWPRFRSAARVAVISNGALTIAQVSNISRGGAEIVGAPEAVHTQDCFVILATDHRRVVSLRFTPRWAKGDRVGGAWHEGPLAPALLLRLVRAGRDAK